MATIPFSEANVAFRVYNENQDLLGIATLELPDIQYMTESLNGSGLGGEIETPVLGLTQSITVKATFMSQTTLALTMMDWTRSQLYECKSALQIGDPSTGGRDSIAYHVNFIGRLKGHTLGSLELGKKHENALEFEVTRLEVFYDSTEKLVIDKMQFIHRVNGKDLWAGVRSQIGLSV